MPSERNSNATITKLPLGLATPYLAPKLVAPAMAAAIAFMAYFLTMPRDITWQSFGGDGGELITASYTLGIPHPPGYPLYVMIGKLFSLIPYGPVAARYSLLSATATALAAAFVTRIAIELAVDQVKFENNIFPLMVGCVASGLTLAFMPLVWSQATIAEVYALNIACLAAFSWALFTKRRPFLIGMFLGLSLTTHLTSALMIPLAVFFLPRRSWPRLVTGLLAGLLPLIALPVFARGDSPVIWGQADTLGGWWWLVSGTLYRPNVLALSPSQWLEKLWLWKTHLLTLLVLPALAIGLKIQMDRENPLRQRHIMLIIATAVGYLVYAFMYRTNDSAVLLLPAILLLVIFTSSVMPRVGVLGIILPSTLALISLNMIIAQPDIPVRQLAIQVLEDAPEKAILVTPGDQSIATMWYFRYVEGMREDTVLVDDNMFQFDWYRERLRKEFPDLGYLERDDLSGFIDYNRINRPVCYISLVQPNQNRCQQTKT